MEEEDGEWVREGLRRRQMRGLWFVLILILLWVTDQIDSFRSEMLVYL